MIFEGLSGFPITPIKNSAADISTLCKIRDHIDRAGLDSIGVLGSTGSFAYLAESERIRVMECWSEAVTPWIAGISATTAAEALRCAHVAKQNGAKGVIANAFAYVPLTAQELQAYFLKIADNSPLPVCVYDNPVTTGQSLSYELLKALAAHPNVKATKVFAKPDNAAQHAQLNALDWSAGYAVDKLCCEAMINGGKAWYSTLAGTVPELLMPVINAIKLKKYEQAREFNQRIVPLYEIMGKHSGYRVMHALANLRGWQCELPPPLQLPELAELRAFVP